MVEIHPVYDPKYQGLFHNTKVCFSRSHIAGDNPNWLRVPNLINQDTEKKLQFQIAHFTTTLDYRRFCFNMFQTCVLLEDVCAPSFKKKLVNHDCVHAMDVLAS